MFDLKKMLPLFEVCPELRPDGLTYEMMPIPRGGWWLREPHSHAESVSTHVHERTAAALCRDRMSEWLEITHGISVVWWKYENGWGAIEGREGECIGEIKDFVRPDRTEAVYMAVCKVLGREP